MPGCTALIISLATEGAMEVNTSNITNTGLTLGCLRPQSRRLKRNERGRERERDGKMRQTETDEVREREMDRAGSSNLLSRFTSLKQSREREDKKRERERDGKVDRERRCEGEKK